MATPAGGHFFCFGRSGGDSKTWAYRPRALRIAHLPPRSGGAPEAPLSAAKIREADFLHSHKKLPSKHTYQKNQNPVRACRMMMYQLTSKGPSMLRKPCLALCLLLSTPAWSQTDAAAPQSGTPETILVVGQRPGPGMWKISKGDHVLWVFATYSPLPANMQWRSQQVEAIIAQSQLYLSPPTLGASVGLWGGMKMLPHMVGMRKNPGGAMLRDVVAPEVYARWRVLKAKYKVSDDAESERPMFAAETLYRAGLQHAGLATSDEVSKTIQALLAKNKVKEMASHVQLDVPHPGKTLKEFKQGTVDDGACFKATIERLETDIEVMRARANAWSKGDLDEIRKLSFADREAACQNAMASSPALRDGLGLAGAEKRVRKLWLEAAEHALATHATSFATLKLSNVLRTDYVMTELQARGYTVLAPD
jgi:hypothetical protein